ncbi:MAG TPA: sigma-70 family RNA polymerase sigma factor [Ktedonobacteraceae bacterium]|nr:sigma-70 family RNA polymerase sigma factor [Ktedonobacteraceae bacterium]
MQRFKKEERRAQAVIDGPVLINQHSDEVLIQAIADREVWAMDPLYQRHHRMLYLFSYHLVSDHQVAENLTQEAFLAVWRRATTYSPQAGTVRNWLLSIVHHRSIDYLRALQRRASLHEINLDAIAEEELALAPDVWDEAWRSVLIAQVRAALRHLPLEQQKVIDLKYFQGWTQSEIAQGYHIPLGTVKVRIRKGLLRLKRVMEQMGVKEL